MGLLVVCDKCKTELGKLYWYLDDDLTTLIIMTDNIHENYKFVDANLYTGHDPEPNNLILCDKCFHDIFDCLKLKTGD